MRKKKLKFYPNVSRKANCFARREYEIGGYEKEWLSKGYYQGFLAGAEAVYKQMRRVTFDEKREAEHYLSRALGNVKEILC